ncbi:MAG: response regulator transcription factor [Paludibacteraceae bacterium]|nr:response regulator transcription factor [Paludibacteraceae bacterium]MBP5136700.1 response regulator transcription factor [Paludibacteraceae bacterium]MBP5742423.1 response regulator transcription factor [Paludibacteraceae bacterium]
MIRILIIEDEIKAAKELKKLIEEQRSDMQVVCITGTVTKTIEWLNENEMPDLIFSDIQLADGLSFEIYKQIKVTAPIVFCTAFDEYAIQAFDANGIDYLLKPIDEEKLARGLEKFSRLRPATVKGDEKIVTDYQQQINSLIQQLDKSYKTSLLVYFQEKIIPIKTEDIDFINSENGIVTAWLNNGKHYILNHTLDTLEGMLNPKIFYKANRQFIINRKAIVNIEHYFTRRLVVKLSQPTPENIIVSKVKASEFLKWVES